MDWYRKRTLGGILDDAGRRWGDREAFMFDDRRWTYAAFNAEANRVAKGLMAMGVAPGEHVALWMTNRPEWLFLMFGIQDRRLHRAAQYALPHRRRDLCGHAVPQPHAGDHRSLGPGGLPGHADGDHAAHRAHGRWSRDRR